MKIKLKMKNNNNKVDMALKQNFHTLIHLKY